jgi:RND family efflux transporter MFP subunit
VNELAALDQPPRTVAILSPIDGHVMMKRVYDGSAVQAGDLVMRLSSRKLIWLDARVFEQDLPLVKIGQKVTATIAAQPGRTFTGTVSFIYPHLDEKTRTALVRVVLPNDDHALLQGMYATVMIHHQIAADAVLAPAEAILDTGVRKLVFVSEGGGHFSAHEVTTGGDGDGGQVQMLSGLDAGQQIVVSGQFLIDSESKLQEALLKHLGQMPSMPGMPGMSSMPDMPSMSHQH